MTDEEFRKLCNTYGFAPSRALRELIDCVRAQEIEACALILDRNVEACINNSAIAPLRVADKLSLLKFNVVGAENALAMEEAAAELRRLYEFAMEQQGKIYALEMARSMQQRTAKLKHDVLLDALKKIAADHAYFSGDTLSYARAAIAKVEEKQ